MRKKTLENNLKKIIEKKHEELNLGRDYTEQFSKIRDFGANETGQIGEAFVKFILSKKTAIIDDGVIHNEYDVVTESGIYFEVKTARLGRGKYPSFQFNGINPNYNYNYLICIGLCEDKALYRMFRKEEIKYIHTPKRKNFMIQNDFKRQLVSMDTKTDINLKLTCYLKDLYSIEKLIDELDAVL